MRVRKCTRPFTRCESNELTPCSSASCPLPPTLPGTTSYRERRELSLNDSLSLALPSLILRLPHLPLLLPLLLPMYLPLPLVVLCLCLWRQPMTRRTPTKQGLLADVRLLRHRYHVIQLCGVACIAMRVSISARAGYICCMICLIR